MQVTKTEQIIHLSFGTRANSIVDKLFQLYAIDYQLDDDCTLRDRDHPTFRYNALFDQQSHSLRPRTIFFDISNTTIQELKTSSKLGKIYSNSQFINLQNEDNPFEFQQFYENVLKKIIKKCSNFQGFFVTCDLGGSVNSTLIVQILSQIRKNLPSCSYIGQVILPQLNSKDKVLQLGLGLIELKQIMNILIMIDYQSVQNVFKTNLQKIQFSPSEIDQLIAQLLSNITLNMRHQNYHNSTLKELIEYSSSLEAKWANLVIIAYAPLLSNGRQLMNYPIMPSIFECFEPANRFLKCFFKHQKYFAVNCIFRGQNLIPKYVNLPFHELRKCHQLVYASKMKYFWPRLGLNYTKIAYFRQTAYTKTIDSCFILFNTTAIRLYLDQIVQFLEQIQDITCNSMQSRIIQQISQLSLLYSQFQAEQS